MTTSTSIHDVTEISSIKVRDLGDNKGFAMTIEVKQDGQAGHSSITMFSDKALTFNRLIEFDAFYESH